MPKVDVIEELRAARSALLQAIEGLTDEQMLRVGAVGIWSVKDVLGHLVSWEAELVTVLSQLEQHKRRAPRIIDIDDIDEWNAEQYHINAPRPLEAILEDFYGVHRHLIQAVERLDNNILDNNRLFPWMEGEPLTYLIAENAIWHEEEHAEDLRAWRETAGI